MTLLRDGPRAAKAAPAEETLVRYEDDALTWAHQQAALLRAERLDALDVENIANEITDVASRKYNKLESALTGVLQHLLKWDHQPGRRRRRWVLSINEHRRRATRHLERHPGLRGQLSDVIGDADLAGRYDALIETDLPVVRPRRMIHPSGLSRPTDSEAVHRLVPNGRCTFRLGRCLEASLPLSNPYSWDDIMNREIAWLET